MVFTTGGGRERPRGQGEPREEKRAAVSFGAEQSGVQRPEQWPRGGARRPRRDGPGGGGVRGPPLRASSGGEWGSSAMSRRYPEPLTRGGPRRSGRERAAADMEVTSALPGFVGGSLARDARGPCGCRRGGRVRGGRRSGLLLLQVDNEELAGAQREPESQGSGHRTLVEGAVESLLPWAGSGWEGRSGGQKEWGAAEGTAGGWGPAVERLSTGREPGGRWVLADGPGAGPRGPGGRPQGQSPSAGAAS